MHRPVGAERHPGPVGRAVNVARMRKFLAVAVLGLVEVAAYVVADPRNLPSWVVTGALAVNALAVYIVRNQPVPTTARSYPPPLRPTEPTRHVRREDRGS